MKTQEDDIRRRMQDITTLISLLDDPDDAIIPIVTARLLSLKPKAATLTWLREQHRNNSVLERRLSKIIADIRMTGIREGLEAWSKERDPELLKGLWLVFRALFPDTAYEPLDEACMDMVKEVWVEWSDDKTVVEKIHLFNHIFYHRIGFQVDDPFLSELQMALLDKALEQKRSNPVLFGLLYLDVAFRTGLPVKAILFPGGFLPACTDDQGRILFYINIYKSGEIFGREQLINFLKEFGVSIPEEQFVFGDVFRLAGVYAESLYFVAGNIENKEMEQVMEQVLKLFGDKRILLIEEDEE